MELTSHSEAVNLLLQIATGSVTVLPLKPVDLGKTSSLSPGILRQFNF